MFFPPFSGPNDASLPHELATVCTPLVRKRILESKEKQSFSLLLIQPILALEYPGLSPTALNPSLLQLLCKDASEPISSLQVYITDYFMNHTFSLVIQHPLFNLHTS